MGNLLISGDIKEKIKWYIKAHGHSSIGGLNLIETYFSFTGKKEQAETVNKAIKLFQNFTDAKKLDEQVNNLRYSLNDVEKVISGEPIQEKRDEMLEILSGVRKNVSRINKIIKNPGYEEKFKLNKILFSTAVQLLRQYPNTLHGDLIGEKGDDIGDRIKLIVKEPPKEKSILCCGYEIQLLIFNLLSNAVDALNIANANGKINMNISYDNNNAVISVSDDGELIKKQDIEKILTKKKFSTKGREHGNGMKIIHDILGKYNGNLNVTSEKEKNLVTFTATITLTH